MTAPDPTRTGSDYPYSADIEDLLRELAPQVLGALVRRYGQFDACEDAVQEALLAAATQWPDDGIPDNPRGWLITVASRRLTDELRGGRRATAARGRRRGASSRPRRGRRRRPTIDDVADADDTLTLLFLCCHPALSPRVAARADAARGRRPDDRPDRRAPSSCRRRPWPSASAARRRRSRAPAPASSCRPSRARRPAARGAARPLPDLQRGLHGLFRRRSPRAELAARGDPADPRRPSALPDDGEVAGLLALMLLTDARRAARTAADGSLVPLADQDRSRWDQARDREGVEIITTRCPAAGSGRTSCRRRSPPSTTRPQRRRHRLAQILDALPAARAGRAQPDGHAEPRRRRRHGRWSAAGLAMLDALEADERMAGTIGSRPSAPTCSRWPARRPPRVPRIDSPRSDHQPPRASLPGGSSVAPRLARVRVSRRHPSHVPRTEVGQRQDRPHPVPSGRTRYSPNLPSFLRRKTSHRPSGEYDPRYTFVTPSWRCVRWRRWLPSGRIVTMLAESSGSKWFAFSVTAIRSPLGAQSALTVSSACTDGSA